MAELNDLSVIGYRHLYLIEWMDALNASMRLVQEAIESGRQFPGSERGSLETWDGVQANLMAMTGMIHDHIEALKQNPSTRFDTAKDLAAVGALLHRLGLGGT